MGWKLSQRVGKRTAQAGITYDEIYDEGEGEKEVKKLKCNERTSENEEMNERYSRGSSVILISISFLC